MITAIRLRNFKGFKNEVEIPLSPITLLYGPNSSGKSSVLHSLLYLYEILKNDQCDVYESSFSDEIDLGGFWNVLHRECDSPEFTIGISYSLSEDVEYEEMRSDYGTLDIDELEALSFVNNLGVLSPSGEYGINYWDIELTVSWSKERKLPYISELSLAVSDGPFGVNSPFCTGNTEHLLSIKSEPDLRSTYISNINFSHYLLSYSDNENGDGPLLKSILHEINANEIGESDYNNVKIYIETDLVGAKPILGKSLKVLSGRKLRNKLDDERHAASIKIRDGEGDLDQLTVRISYLNNKIAHTDSVITVLQEFFSRAIVGVLDTTTTALNKMVAIGPIRDIPSRQFTSPKNTNKKRWYGGLAAWDAVRRCSDMDFENISRWLFRLRTGYFLKRSVIPSSAAQNNSMKIKQEKYGIKMHEEYDVLITDMAGNGFHVQDLGTGISQIFPIVVASCLREVGLIVIEQPELHIHPRLQVELGDLFAETISKYSESDRAPPKDENSFLIETHSEHMLLRLLRRVRETTHGNIEEQSKRLSQNYLSVIYIENKNGSATAQRLRLDSEGEFIDRWPEGFFRERSDELF